MLRDPFVRELAAPADERVNPGDNCAPFGASTRTSAALLPVSSSRDRLSGDFSDDTDPTDFLEGCRFLESMYWHSWLCLWSIPLARGAARQARSHTHSAVYTPRSTIAFMILTVN